MYKTCNICHRSPLKGNSRSHSKIATRKWQNLNLQTKIIDGKRVKVCTRCIRTLVKQKATS